ncbi:MAG: hypothetical protein GQ564_22490 [Bacteroidales bacterium]|nr:hypothetical protein [Bacteroidales bacterium]
MKKIILLVFTVLVFNYSKAQIHCGGFNKCTDAQAEEANEALLLSNQRIKELKDLHFFNGKPRNSSNKDIIILTQEGFIVGYDTILNLPLWTSYFLTKEWAEIERDRIDCFRDDPRLNKTKTQINCDYYKGSGFNRGHLSPRNDFNRSEIVQLNTFLFSNMIPQYPKHNQRMWRFLEEYVNNLAESIDSIYIITGIAFDYDGNGRPDSKDDLPLLEQNTRPLAIPSHIYKIVIKKRNDDTIEAISFLTVHDNIGRNKEESLSYLKDSCLVSIDVIEKLTGSNFFWSLDNKTERKLEKNIQKELW